MLIFAAALCLLFGVDSLPTDVHDFNGSSDVLININKDVDAVIDVLNNQAVHSIQLGKVEIGDLIYDDVHLADFTTLQRDGNAWAKIEGDRTYVNIGVSLKNMQLRLNGTSYPDISPVNFHILANSALLEGVITNYGNPKTCSSQFTSLAVNYLYNVYSVSRDPEFDGLSESHAFWKNLKNYFQNVVSYEEILNKANGWVSLCNKIPALDSIDV